MERDGINTYIIISTFYFNSHAHVERDEIVRNWINAQSISTHTLTWSVTYSGFATGTNYQDFNSHAHVERDTLKWEITLLAIFQLTRSRGA